MCGTCERRGTSAIASMNTGVATGAAAQAAAAADEAGDSALPPSAQRINAALDRLITGRLSDDEQLNAEAAVAGRRMSRLLYETSYIVYGNGWSEGVSDDAAGQRDISTDEALASLGTAMQDPHLDDGPPLTVRDGGTFGSSEWSRRQIDAGVAPWEDIHAVARQWIQKPHPEMSSKIIGRTAEAFKSTSENAANYIRQAESLRRAWA